MIETIDQPFNFLWQITRNVSTKANKSTSMCDVRAPLKQCKPTTMQFFRTYYLLRITGAAWKYFTSHGFRGDIAQVYCEPLSKCILAEESDVRSVWKCPSVSDISRSDARKHASCITEISLAFLLEPWIFSINVLIMYLCKYSLVPSKKFLKLNVKNEQILPSIKCKEIVDFGSEVKANFSAHLK